jgi:hypothetical protein
VTDRFVRHAKSPEHVAERIVDGITSNRYLVYTSTDIRLLHLMQRMAPHSYSALMRRMNNLFVTQMARLGGSGPA